MEYVEKIDPDLIDLVMRYNAGNKDDRIMLCVSYELSYGEDDRKWHRESDLWEDPMTDDELLDFFADIYEFDLIKNLKNKGGNNE